MDRKTNELNMNKKELIRIVTQELNFPISQEKVSLVLDKAIEITHRTLDTGESVKWSGFGSLVIKEISPKTLYSPVLKKYIVSKGSRKIVFRESGKSKRSMSE